jgi:hypothetical protein
LFFQYLFQCAIHFLLYFQCLFQCAIDFLTLNSH